MADKKYTKEYAILGRYRKDTRFKTLAGGPPHRITDKTEAEKTLQKLRRDAQEDMKRKGPAVFRTNMFSVSVPHDSDYDIVEFRLVEREVSDWVTIHQVDTIDYTTEGDKDIAGMFANGAQIIWTSQPETTADDVYQIVKYGVNQYHLTLRRLQDNSLHVIKYEQIVGD